MKDFSALFTTLDTTTKTNDRITALTHYLTKVSDNDALWAIALLGGKRPKRPVTSTLIRQWVLEQSGVSEWLFDECYQVVGDMSETISLLLPETTLNTDKSLTKWMQEIGNLRDQTDDEKREYVVDSWNSLDRQGRFVFNKLIGGSFRIGVSQKTMVKALSRCTGKPENELAHRLMGNWDPQSISFDELVLSDKEDMDMSKPYPFFLAYPLEDSDSFDASWEKWIVERKWDGIRGQLIKRSDQLFIWSRGEELVTDKYPELHGLGNLLPDGTVIDGELLPYKDGKPLTFSLLQKRIGRKSVGKKLLEEVPVILLSYDLLESEGQDIRNTPLNERRSRLATIIEATNHPNLKFSEEVKFSTLEDLKEERNNSRKHYSEGLMIKRRSSAYQVGRKKGDWWKWKVDPLVIDAVLIYAMRGHGRRANLYTDYTFAVWDNQQLVPFTKAYSGLTDAEFRQVDRFVKANVIDKFGPVRSVKPELVFEIAFEGIAKSTRHKSGIALRFPRMSRWRKDKKAEEANTLQDLNQLLEVYGS